MTDARGEIPAHFHDTIKWGKKGNFLEKHLVFFECKEPG
jgi:hypothetical protein